MPDLYLTHPTTCLTSVAGVITSIPTLYEIGESCIALTTPGCVVPCARHGCLYLTVPDLLNQTGLHPETKLAYDQRPHHFHSLDLYLTLCAVLKSTDYPWEAS